MPLTPDLAALADETYVSLTTFRRSGEGVSTPVWVASDGDALLVWTARTTGKVTRLRSDPVVELRACDRRGQVAASARVVAARAVVAEDAATLERAERAMVAAYGVQFRVARLVERLRRASHERVAIVITPA
ncbi:hypothetical protein CLV28_2933 [Sediminihabitans luteus]|uniref:Pyridoxamine 5'-phosphate oxidase N-terminal domain-containing protein n=1 Tax=Sediminihabitans luteus TaxID=1138585 RepID=A0A2M9CCT8_9CELL|nr:PPOX class F420-dependent oxidoreductase [Sediminihabitans luteus]PJJ69123.1 hypothetical protein CLV28_2933 [Sediminihabitans luteus]GII99509.1 PPOX class F420-dependent oxidoreductase [Sediminihabitans luteus]